MCSIQLWLSMTANFEVMKLTVILTQFNPGISSLEWEFFPSGSQLTDRNYLLRALYCFKRCQPCSGPVGFQAPFLLNVLICLYASNVSF